MSLIAVRPFEPLKDAGFIFSTWPKSVYYSGINLEDCERKSDWFKAFHIYINNLLPESEISIACMQDDPGIIIGYCIVSGRTLQFIYIKELFRKQGIARLLLKLNPQIREINYAFMTRVGDAILAEHPNYPVKEESTLLNTQKEEVPNESPTKKIN